MNSLIFQTAARFLLPLMLVFSVFLLLRGHNHPGGGFSGALVASAAFLLYAIAFDTAAARRLLRVDPHRLVGVGLLLALCAGLPGLFAGESLFHALWWTELKPAEHFKLVLGTPFLFDIGVYFAVFGGVLLIFFTLKEESS